ncbi:hypothetical protein AAGW05_13810 [Arthrobacter sp. LAPM80]|uniref:hypothetical protein n=1 Tax=Arthrobacter sp. LAPM80 TaxID=3141788 RepID=UPI00398B00B9
MTCSDQEETSRLSRDLWVAIAWGVVAALSLRAGMTWLGTEQFVRLASVLVLPWMAAFFVWKRNVPLRTVGIMAAGYVATAVLLVAYPFTDEHSDTLLLAAIHTPILLWLLTGVLYMGGESRPGRRRMDFIRFTGEWAV